MDAGAFERMHRRVDRAVTLAGEQVGATVDVDAEADALGAPVLVEVVFAVADRGAAFKVGLREQTPRYRQRSLRRHVSRHVAGRHRRTRPASGAA